MWNTAAENHARYGKLQLPPQTHSNSARAERLGSPDFFFSQAASPVVAQLRHYRFSTRCLKDTWPLALVASAEKRMPGTNAQATCAQQLELEPRVSKKSERTETPADNSSRSCTCEPHLAYPSLEPSDTEDAVASQRHPGREHTCP